MPSADSRKSTIRIELRPTCAAGTTKVLAATELDDAVDGLREFAAFLASNLEQDFVYEISIATRLNPASGWSIDDSAVIFGDVGLDFASSLDRPLEHAPCAGPANTEDLADTIAAAISDCTLP